MLPESSSGAAHSSLKDQFRLLCSGREREEEKGIVGRYYSILGKAFKNIFKLTFQETGFPYATNGFLGHLKQKQP